jgi:hypothetical protein
MHKMMDFQLAKQRHKEMLCEFFAGGLTNLPRPLL